MTMCQSISQDDDSMTMSQDDDSMMIVSIEKHGISRVKGACVRAVPDGLFERMLRCIWPMRWWRIKRIENGE
jgi:hypothetical protein